MRALLYLRWRGGLLIASGLLRVGSALSDAGWALRNKAGREWYRPGFNPAEGRRQA